MSSLLPVISFLSDYGLRDEFVGICHAVIAGICPAARIIDIAHGIRRHDVRAGALTLRDAVGYLPAGVILAVVDPDVGAQRRAVALELADGRRLVGPDNGLLALVAERGGGVVQAVEIAHSPFRLEPVAATFHGRDIFAPVAAHLAAGIPLAETGEPLDPSELMRLELPRPCLSQGMLHAHVLLIDRFGNAALDATHEDLEATGLRLGHPVTLQPSGAAPQAAHFVRTFADVPSGDLLLYEDAQRRLAVAVSGGDAARRLALAVDDELRIAP